MKLFEDLLHQLPRQARTLEVVVGMHWTAVVVEVNEERQCGLASSVHGEVAHGEVNDVAAAGELQDKPTLDLAHYVYRESLAERAIGMATINALLPRLPERWTEANASEVIARRGRSKRVALVGHFPFIPELRQSVGKLNVLEESPLPGELPAGAAAEVLPTCEVIAIAAMTLLNGTFEDLIVHTMPEAYAILLGPRAPLDPVLFDYRIPLVAGTLVERTEEVLRAIQQGANFRQIHRIGTQLVNLAEPR